MIPSAPSAQELFGQCLAIIRQFGVFYDERVRNQPGLQLRIDAHDKGFLLDERHFAIQIGMFLHSCQETWVAVYDKITHEVTETRIEEERSRRTVDPVVLLGAIRDSLTSLQSSKLRQAQFRQEISWFAEQVLLRNLESIAEGVGLPHPSQLDTTLVTLWPCHFVPRALGELALASVSDARAFILANPQFQQAQDHFLEDRDLHLDIMDTETILKRGLHQRTRYIDDSFGKEGAPSLYATVQKAPL